MMATRRLYFYWQNWFDSATVTASSEATDYAAANLQNRWATFDWRSTAADTAGEWIKANLGSAKAVKSIILEHMNLRAGDTVALEGNATDAWGAPSYSLPITITAAMVAAGRIVITLAAAQTYQWWRLTMADAGNPDGYLSASRVYLGPCFEPGLRYGPTPTQVRDSASEVGESSGGQSSAVKRPKRWTYDLPITILGQTDADAYADMDDECGIDTPLWVCFDSTDEPTNTVYVRFAEHIPFPAVIDGSLWETSIRLRQEL
jgi:hypothetical protein